VCPGIIVSATSKGWVYCEEIDRVARSRCGHHDHRRLRLGYVWDHCEEGIFAERHWHDGNEEESLISLIGFLTLGAGYLKVAGSFAFSD
jgi:hypothetical protein